MGNRPESLIQKVEEEEYSIYTLGCNEERKRV
jgi:hypothetical protein